MLLTAARPRLTAAEIRRLEPEFAANLTDEQIDAVLQQLRQLAGVFSNVYRHQKKGHHGEKEK